MADFLTLWICNLDPDLFVQGNAVPRASICYRLSVLFEVVPRF